MDHHKCPWPKCDRQVMDIHWGCRPHFNRLPTAYRNNWYRAAQMKASPADFQRIASHIDAWVESLPENYTPSTATPDLPSKGIVSGVSSEGNLTLFWPAASELLTIEREHMPTLLAGIRAVLGWKGGRNV